MRFFKQKKNNLYSQLFYTYSYFTVIFILILICISYFIANMFIINSNRLSVMNSLEKATSNMTYMLQQDVNLAWSLAKENTIVQGVNGFLRANDVEKIDVDIEIKNFLNSYWN